MNINAMLTTNKEFFQQACRWKDCSSVQTAAQWWNAFQEVIVREIFYNGCCRIPGLGRFGVEERPGGYKKTKTDKGREVTYYVPARVVPVFTPEDDFINDVNMQGVTKIYRKRLRRGELTQRDFERELRAEALKADAMLNEMVAQRKKKSQKEFQELLVRKRKKKEEANERNKGRTNSAVPIIQMDLDGNEIARFNSISEAMKMTGIDKTHISCACSGLYGRKTAKGYRWKYAERQEKDEIGNDEFDESEACDTES